MKFFRNPWLWVSAIPVAAFIILMLMGVDSDVILQVASFGLFIALAGVFIYYMRRAPFLWFDGDVSRESRTIIGTATFAFGAMFNIGYGWVFRQMGRPQWLLDQYWSAASISIMCLGLLIIASAARPPKPPTGPAGRVSTFILGILSASAFFLSGLSSVIVSKLTLLGSVLGKMFLVLH